MLSRHIFFSGEMFSLVNYNNYAYYRYIDEAIIFVTMTLISYRYLSIIAQSLH